MMDSWQFTLLIMLHLRVTALIKARFRHLPLLPVVMPALGQLLTTERPRLLIIGVAVTADWKLCTPAAGFARCSDRFADWSIMCASELSGTGSHAKKH